MLPNERVEHLWKETKRLGLDQPTDEMIADMIRDAEFDTIWHPLVIAKRHDQDAQALADIWCRALLLVLPKMLSQ